MKNSTSSYSFWRIDSNEMVVIGCSRTVLSILLFLFGVNNVLIMFCIQCIATDYVMSFCTVICLYNILVFCNKYFESPSFSRWLSMSFKTKKNVHKRLLQLCQQIPDLYLYMLQAMPMMLQSAEQAKMYAHRSVQLPKVSGADNKLGLSTVWCATLKWTSPLDKKHSVRVFDVQWPWLTYILLLQLVS